jgi:hypothetical protein
VDIVRVHSNLNLFSEIDAWKGFAVHPFEIMAVTGKIYLWMVGKNAYRRINELPEGYAHQVIKHQKISWTQKPVLLRAISSLNGRSSRWKIRKDMEPIETFLNLFLNIVGENCLRENQCIIYDRILFVLIIIK